MKVAIVYNRQSQRVINLFGTPNREKYGLAAIKRISDSLKKGGHQVTALEGDKDLIDKLEEFMPRVIKGERPGMVFNLSYGIQGQARYTHVPGMLEMIGLPYVGSGPLAHSLALDKVVSKMIFVQHGLPTADFAVLEDVNFDMPELEFPLIVKPKNEAVSFGIQIVKTEKELRAAADLIFQEFAQPVLAEQYIAGREINVGLLGNNPTEALPTAEILFGEGGPQIYTYEDKTRKSGRTIDVECPAKLSKELTEEAQRVARRAFEVLGCFDCARVDMRLDDQNNLYILEVNSLPSLGMHGSYVQGAAAVGLDFPDLVNRLVEVAAARYFGVPHPPELSPKAGTQGDRIVSFLSANRDRLERETRDWTRVRSRTADPVGIHEAVGKLEDELTELGFKPNKELTDSRVAWTWTTPGGFGGGTLLVGHLDVPLETEVVTPIDRREPEWLYGEGIGSSRAPLVSMLFALRALRRVRRLRKRPIGILYYGDEGRDCRYSSEIIRQAMAEARHVIVLRPGNIGDHMVVARRGQRQYRVTIEGVPLRLGKPSKQPEPLPWAFEKLQACAKLSSRKDRIAVATIDLRTTHMPMLLPNRVSCTLLVSYPNEKVANEIEEQIRTILQGKGIRSKIERLSSRPPMKERRANLRLANALTAVAAEWEIPLKRESSVWPSVAGLAPASTGVVCGLGPVARNIYTPDESVDRISLMQRTLLLAEFLAKHGADSK
jgi:D-alanine-D-alanine ligase